MDPKNIPNTSQPFDDNKSLSQPELIYPNSNPAPTVITPDQPNIAQPLNNDATSPMVTPTQPQAVVPAQSQTFTTESQTSAGPSPAGLPNGKKKFPRIAIFSLLTVVLLAIGGAAYYFGYYSNSSYVYKQALANTGKGFTELTNQLLATNTAEYKGYTGSGSYKFDSEQFKTDGKLAFKTDKTNSETVFDIGVGVTRLDFIVRSLKSDSTNPDIYFNAKGLNGLGQMLGPEYGALAAKYNDQWIVVDHTLLDNAQTKLAGVKENTTPTTDQIVDEVNAFTKVNEEYIFSSDPETSVTTVLETYGKKNVDGRSVIHYKVGYNEANVKKYITAQHTALKSSKLNDWIKANEYTEQVDDYHKDLLKSAASIKASDTFELYADMNSRVVYKVRFSESNNPAVNYVEVGLDYKGKSELPFFIAGKSETDKTDFKMNIKANTETDVVAVDFKVTSAKPDNSTITANFNFKPTKELVKITKPESAKPIAEVFGELGLGDPLGAVSTVGETLGVSTSQKKL